MAAFEVLVEYCFEAVSVAVGGNSFGGLPFGILVGFDPVSEPRLLEGASDNHMFCLHSPPVAGRMQAPKAALVVVPVADFEPELVLVLSEQRSPLAAMVSLPQLVCSRPW
jgi:hypothetical protein